MLLPLCFQFLVAGVMFFFISSLSTVCSLASIRALPGWPLAFFGLDPLPPLFQSKGLWSVCGFVCVCLFSWTAPCCPHLAQIVIDLSVGRPRVESPTWALDHTVSIPYSSLFFFSYYSFQAFFLITFSNIISIITIFSWICQINKTGYICVHLKFITMRTFYFPLILNIKSVFLINTVYLLNIESFENTKRHTESKHHL